MTRAFLLLPTLLLGGCISLLPEPAPAPALFVLEAGEVARVQGERVDAVIAVAAPDGERILLGADMVWRTGDQIAFVAQSQWSGRGQELLQAMLVETMARQGRFRAAVRLGEANSDYQLRWTVRDFEIVEAGMSARLAAEIMLLAPGRRVVASEHVLVETPLADRSASAAANALARAAREGSARIGLFAADAAAQEQARVAAEASDQGGVN